jgi:hypothetical protein
MEERQVNLQLSDEESENLNACICTVLKSRAISIPGELVNDVNPDSGVLMDVLRKLREAIRRPM